MLKKTRVRPDAKCPVGSEFTPVLASKSATVRCSVAVSVVGLDSMVFSKCFAFPLYRSMLLPLSGPGLVGGVDGEPCSVSDGEFVVV